MRKKLFSIVLTLMLVLSLCACASAQDNDETTQSQSTEKNDTNSEEPDVTEKPTAEPDVTEEPDNDTNSKYSITVSESLQKKLEKRGMDANDINELFEILESSILSYCDEYDINPDEFVWPEYKRDGLTELDEENAWMYLTIIYTNYKAVEEKYLLDGFEYELPSEKNIALMHAVLDGFVTWSEEHITGDLTPNLVLTPVEEIIFPLGEKLPEILVFTSE